MRSTLIITNEGPKREIDFEGATLPDGRQIQSILDENEKFKQDITNLMEKTSILSRLIPSKRIRDPLEIILLIFAILGIVDILLIIIHIIN